MTWWRTPWLRLVRPTQWSKNAILFAGAVFGASLDRWDSVVHATLAFAAFCLGSSAVYILNDIVDAPADRLHPRKRLRPIAAGRIAPGAARIVAIILMTGAVSLASVVGFPFLGVLTFYLAMMVTYCYRLKDVVILDVFVISAGFLLRAAGGALAVNVPISPWLLVCTGLLALFLGFGKRRGELVQLTPEAREYRKTLGGYTVPLLDQSIAVTAASTILAYSTYTFNASAVPDNHVMMITIPFVAFAMFRYLFLVYAQDQGSSPETLLFRDRALLASIVMWGITVVVISFLR